MGHRVKKVPKTHSMGLKRQVAGATFLLAQPRIGEFFCIFGIKADLRHGASAKTSANTRRLLQS